MPAKKPKDEDLMLPDPSQDDLDLYDFIEEIGGQISIVDVFRMARDGSMPHIDRVTIDAIREDVYSYLRSFGPGKYCLQFKSADRQIKRRRTIEVADRNPAPGAAPVAATVAPDHVQYLREQLAQQQTLLLALIGNLGGNKGPDLSFLAGVLKPPDMTPVVTLMSAMLNRKEGGMDGVQLAKTIVELAKDVGGGDSGKEDNLWSVAKEVGGQFFKALPPAPPGYDPNAPPPAALPAPVSPGPPPAPPAAPTQPEENIPMTKENFPRLLAAGIGELKHMARKNRDIDAAIDWVLECAEDTPTWAAVAGAVQQGATFDNLLQFDPEIAQTPQLKDWFSRFYNGLHTEIFQHVDTAGPGGHAVNPGDHAGAGAAGPVATPDPKSS